MSASLETFVVLLAMCGALRYADSSPEERDHSKHERLKQVAGQQYNILEPTELIVFYLFQLFMYLFIFEKKN